MGYIIVASTSFAVGLLIGFFIAALLKAAE